MRASMAANIAFTSTASLSRSCFSRLRRSASASVGVRVGPCPTRASVDAFATRCGVSTLSSSAERESTGAGAADVVFVSVSVLLDVLFCWGLSNTALIRSLRRRPILLPQSTPPTLPRRPLYPFHL